MMMMMMLMMMMMIMMMMVIRAIPLRNASRSATKRAEMWYARSPRCACGLQPRSSRDAEIAPRSAAHRGAPAGYSRCGWYRNAEPIATTKVGEERKRRADSKESARPVRRAFQKPSSQKRKPRVAWLGWSRQKGAMPMGECSGRE